MSILVSLSYYSMALLLLWAATGKWRTLGAFEQNLVQSFAIPPGQARLLAPTLALAESAAAITLLMLAWQPDPAWTAPLMAACWCLLALFSLTLLQRFFTNDTIKCSCFGEQDRPLSGYDLIRNGLLLLVTAGFFLAPDVLLPLQSALSTSCLLLSALLVMLIAASHDIASLWQLNEAS